MSTIKTVIIYTFYIIMFFLLIEVLKLQKLDVDILKLKGLFNQKKLLPCSTLLEGEYGYKELFVGVPIVIGESGVEKIYEIDIDDADVEPVKINTRIPGKKIKSVEVLVKVEDDKS